MSRLKKISPGKPDISIRDRAYLHIQRQIASGALEPGTGVSELLLAKDLDSSRTPIREAMNQLAAEGLLRQSTGGGMVVSQLTRQDIIELYEMREALEVYAAGKIAAVPLQSADRARLQALIDQIEKMEEQLSKSRKTHLDPPQMERFIECDLGFHALLMSMSNNSRLQKVINDTRLLISIFAIHRTGHDARALRGIREYHQMILDTLTRQDGPAAMSSLASHIQASKDERLQEFDHWKRESALRSTMPVFFDIHRMRRKDLANTEK